MDKKRIKFLLTFSWAILIALLMVLPIKSVAPNGFSYLDKLVHSFLFGVFTYLLFEYIHLVKQKGFLSSSFYAVFFSSFYAFFIEILQRYIPGRSLDMADLLAGFLGALFFIILTSIIYRPKKPKLLLHICCIGCGVYVSQILKKEFRVSLFFYNPNIFPLQEYEKRLEEIKKVAKLYSIKVIIGEYNHLKWREMVRGYESEPERGSRCMLCYRERLDKTASHAASNGFQYFTSTLTTSPHKSADAIFTFGHELAKKYGINFLDRDFKKKEGFKKAAALSKSLELYRQDYCGCEFSLAGAKRRRDKNNN